MLETLKEIDTQWFLWVNSHHTTALDWTMWTLSQHWSWAVVIMLAFVLLTLRKEPRRWWLVAVGVVLCFLLADQGSGLIKDTVCRLRPCHALEEVRMFRTGKGGLYGFPSSHAANAFSVAIFLSLAYGRKHKTLAWILFSWATIVAYSRPYLGKHYPADILCGALLGLGIGAAVYFVISRIRARTSSRRSA